MICDFFLINICKVPGRRKTEWDGETLWETSFLFISQESSEVKKKKKEMDHLFTKLDGQMLGPKAHWGIYIFCQ